jgi:hypothetical protein
VRPELAGAHELLRLLDLGTRGGGVMQRQHIDARQRKMVPRFDQ